MTLEEIAVDEEFAFTLDHKRMVQVLKRNRLSDRHSYIKDLLVYSASTNPSKIRITGTPWKITIIDDGDSITYEDLEDRLAQIFVGDEMDELAGGILSAFDAQVREVKIECVPKVGEAYQQRIIEENEIPTPLDREELRSRLKKGTRITLYKKGLIDTSTWRRTLKSLLSLRKRFKVPELALARAATTGTEHDIRINYRKTKKHKKGQRCFIQVPVDHNGVKGTVGFPYQYRINLANLYETPAQSKVNLYRKGFFHGEYTFDKAYGRDLKDLADEHSHGPIVASLSYPRLRVDISGNSLVEDGKAKRVIIEAIRDAIPSLYENLLSDDEHAEERRDYSLHFIAAHIPLFLDAWYKDNFPRLEEEALRKRAQLEEELEEKKQEHELLMSDDPDSMGDGSPQDCISDLEESVSSKMRSLLLRIRGIEHELNDYRPAGELYEEELAAAIEDYQGKRSDHLEKKAKFKDGLLSEDENEAFLRDRKELIQKHLDRRRFMNALKEKGCADPETIRVLQKPIEWLDYYAHFENFSLAERLKPIVDALLNEKLFHETTQTKGTSLVPYDGLRVYWGPEWYGGLMSSSREPDLSLADILDHIWNDGYIYADRMGYDYRSLNQEKLLVDTKRRTLEQLVLSQFKNKKVPLHGDLSNGLFYSRWKTGPMSSASLALTTQDTNKKLARVLKVPLLYRPVQVAYTLWNEALAQPDADIFTKLILGSIVIPFAPYLVTGGLIYGAVETSLKTISGTTKYLYPHSVELYQRAKPHMLRASDKVIDAVSNVMRGPAGKVMKYTLIAPLAIAAAPLIGAGYAMYGGGKFAAPHIGASLLWGYERFCDAILGTYKISAMTTRVIGSALHPSIRGYFDAREELRKQNKLLATGSDKERIAAIAYANWIQPVHLDKFSALVGQTLEDSILETQEHSFEMKHGMIAEFPKENTPLPIMQKNGRIYFNAGVRAIRKLARWLGKAQGTGNMAPYLGSLLIDMLLIHDNPDEKVTNPFVEKKMHAYQLDILEQRKRQYIENLVDTYQTGGCKPFIERYNRLDDAGKQETLYRLMDLERRQPIIDNLLDKDPKNTKLFEEAGRKRVEKAALNIIDAEWEEIDEPTLRAVGE